MEILKQHILKYGRALDADVLLVDSFLNNQVDPSLMFEIGKAFAERFANEQITKIVTVESSGIAPAVMAALQMKVPLVILKKAQSRILKEDLLQTEVFSFTKNAFYQLTLKKAFIQPDDRVLIIDDFLANGGAAFGCIKLLEEAGAKVAGVGAVVAKVFQPGRERLVEAGYRVECLAPVKAMSEGCIEFE